jgi:hypothetical protein
LTSSDFPLEVEPKFFCRHFRQLPHTRQRVIPGNFPERRKISKKHALQRVLFSEFAHGVMREFFIDCGRGARPRRGGRAPRARSNSIVDR